MVTNPEEEPEAPGRAELAQAAVDSFVRTVVSGSSVGAVRRILLYAVVATVLGVGLQVDDLFGIVALVLLLATDRDL